VRPFHNRAHRFFRGDAGRSDKSETADAARLERPNRGSGHAAQVITRELLRAAPRNQQQTLRHQRDRPVHQIGFEWLAGNFAAGQQIGRDRLHGSIGGRDFEFRLLVLLFIFVFVGCSAARMVKYHRDQRFSFERRGGSERNCRFHILLCDPSDDCSSIVGGTGKAQAPRPERARSDPAWIAFIRGGVIPSGAVFQAKGGICPDRIRPERAHRPERRPKKFKRPNPGTMPQRFLKSKLKFSCKFSVSPRPNITKQYSELNARSLHISPYQNHRFVWAD